MRIIERETSTVYTRFILGNPHGEKSQQKIFNIDSSTSTMSPSREISPK
jgi:hypothetical protein